MFQTTQLVTSCWPKHPPRPRLGGFAHGVTEPHGGRCRLQLRSSLDENWWLFRRFPAGIFGEIYGKIIIKKHHWIPIKSSLIHINPMKNHHLVGGRAQPLWKIWVRQLGWWHSQYDGKNKSHVPNHQPDRVLYGVNVKKHGWTHGF